jgi:riboflavin kinase / FMN adenylyltransferase
MPALVSASPLFGGYAFTSTGTFRIASLKTRAASRRPRMLSVSSLLHQPTTGVVLVAGKFDAFHRGHRELVRAAAAMGLGAPTLLSFSGMAAALGWPPRPSVVAPVERPAILRDWSAAIGASVSYHALPFDDVRTLSPRDFIALARSGIGAAGIVCGPDWRFGHRAAGNVDLLREIAAESKGQFAVCVVDPVGLEGEPDVVVSSTSVRLAIANGDVALAARLMDRPHRLVGSVVGVCRSSIARNGASVQCGEFVNQVPGHGVYSCAVRVRGKPGPARRVVRIQRAEEMLSTADVSLLLPPDLDEAAVWIEDGEDVYCVDCDITIDFLARIREKKQ